MKRYCNTPTQLPFLRILCIGPTDTSTVWCELISGMGRTRQWCCSTSLSPWVWWQCTQPGSQQVWWIDWTWSSLCFIFIRWCWPFCWPHDERAWLFGFCLCACVVWQLAGENHCLRSSCTHICLLSAVGPRYYSCACPSGWMLAADQITCTRGMRPATWRKTLITQFDEKGSQIRCSRYVEILRSSSAVVIATAERMALSCFICSYLNAGKRINLWKHLTWTIQILVNSLPFRFSCKLLFQL